MNIPKIVDCYTPIPSAVWQTYEVQEQAKARAGGVTHLTIPGIDMPAIAGETIADIQFLAKTHKIFHVPPVLLDDLPKLKNAYIYLAATNSVAMVPLTHPAFPDSGISGVTAVRRGLKATPSLTEHLAIDIHIALAEETGAHLHFPVISSKGAIERLMAAQKRGVAVTGGTSIGHLIFSEKDLHNTPVEMLSAPPFRSLGDQAALIAAINSGALITICSNHCPHLPAAKDSPVSDAAIGVNILPFFGGLVATLQSRVDEERLHKALCDTPARLLDIAAPTGTVSLSEGEYCELLRMPVLQSS